MRFPFPAMQWYHIRNRHSPDNCRRSKSTVLLHIAILQGHIWPSDKEFRIILKCMSQTRQLIKTCQTYPSFHKYRLILFHTPKFPIPQHGTLVYISLRSAEPAVLISGQHRSPGQHSPAGRLQPRHYSILILEASTLSKQMRR